MTVKTASAPRASAAIIARDLPEALAADRLDLLFQPKVSLVSHSLVGVEALVRWTHPILGSISPAMFIAAAEKNGLIDDLTYWVLKRAIQTWRDWSSAGFVTSIAVNASAQNLRHTDFPDVVDEQCRRFAMPPERLTIELTESATQNAVNLMDNLTRLRLKGVGVSIDDFGTGYSSLAQLHLLPFTEMKIDRSFVAHLETSRDSQIIVKSIIDLGHNLGMSVTAEGVECQAAAAFLLDLRCDTAQGFYFARPLPGADVPIWSEVRKGNSATG